MLSHKKSLEFMSKGREIFQLKCQNCSKTLNNKSNLYVRYCDNINFYTLLETQTVCKLRSPGSGMLPFHTTSSRSFVTLNVRFPFELEHNDDMNLTLKHTEAL